MYTADKNSNQRGSSVWRKSGRVFGGVVHRLMAFALLGMTGSALAAPAPIATGTTAA
ncbi:biopolymer transporter ExbB, partial [Dickeya dianthicola]|nr:biopolymer transporter ExbB [Dickeya dianthicola]MBI0456238.1 biopolymer transporter ExbB [Dickeya dianthicola]